MGTMSQMVRVHTDPHVYRAFTGACCDPYSKVQQLAPEPAGILVQPLAERCSTSSETCQIDIDIVNEFNCACSKALR